MTMSLQLPWQSVISTNPQDDFDALFGFAAMGFRKMSFDFEDGLFGWEWQKHHSLRFVPRDLILLNRSATQTSVMSALITVHSAIHTLRSNHGQFAEWFGIGDDAPNLERGWRADREIGAR